MSRFLFVVLPLAGHANPTWAIGQALEERGHEVAWVGSAARLRPWLGPDAMVYPTGMRLYRGRADTGMAAVKSLWAAFLIPFARFSLPAVEQAVEAYRPDVLVVDQHALAGALAARRRGLPWATLCTSLIELVQPFRDLPKVEAWIGGQLATLSAAAGLPPGPAGPPGDIGGVADGDLRFSPYLVLALTSAALLGPGSLPDHVALVGSALCARPAKESFQWDRFDPDRRHVLVTVGTLAEDIAAESTDFYARAVQALRLMGDRVQGIVVAPAGAIADPPEHVLVVPRAPFLELMPHLDAVICHGGLNTMSEALTYGVPIVVAPLTRDQPINAAQVVATGAAVRVSFGRVSPQELRAALTAVLDDPAYRAAARRVGDSLTAAGGAPAAAERLEWLARQSAGAG
jgi:UDP:flavonoid glycosyltransferase YjiC (YdhE family)